MSRAYEESKTKSKRLAAAWDTKRRNADKKILTKRCPKWLEPKKDKTAFKAIEERSITINKIFRMKRNGKGAGRIARELDEERRRLET